MLDVGVSFWQAARDGAAPPFSPLSLGSALVAWYDASVGVYKDGGTTPAANNDTVQQWQDQSGSAHHLNQATAGKRPTLKTTGLNGKKAVNFSAAAATAMFAQNFPISAGSGFSAVAVARMNAATDNYGRLISYVSNADGAGTGNDYTGANNGAILLRQGTNANFGGYRDADLADVAVFTGNAYRISMVFDGANLNSRLNNQTGDIFRGVPSATTMCESSPGVLQVGGVLQVISGVVQASSGDNWDGPLSELILVNRALTTQEQANLDLYLSKKWGMYLAATTAKNVILDTDNDSDVGDVMAIQTAVALHLAGAINLSAVLTNSRNNLAAECARVILAANGLGSIPIGAFKGTTPTTISNSDPYCTTVAMRFGNTGSVRSTYPDAVTVARTALAAMANGSGHYINIGYGPNLAALLTSAADGISALTGPNLMAAKVARCTVMGGNYDDTNAEFNIAGDPADWASIISNRPSTVPFYWFGADWFSSVVMHPNAAANPLTSPSYYAATLAGDNQGGGVYTRPAWDAAAIFAGALGDASGIQVFGVKGGVAINGTTGVTTFTGSGEAGNDNYLYWGGASAAISASLNALIANVL